MWCAVRPAWQISSTQVEHVLYIETPQLRCLAGARSERVLQTLKFAVSLGAATAVLTGNDILQNMVRLRAQPQFSKIVLGHSRRSWVDSFPISKRATSPCCSC